MFSRRFASAPLIRAMSRANGSSWRSASESFTSAALLGVEGLGAARQQQLQERLGVGVEEARNSSGLTLRLGRGERDRRALLDVRVGWCPGRPRSTMSLRPVFGRSSSEASSLISGAYLLSTSIVTTAWPSSSSTPGDVADLDPGDVDRLALARRHGLGGRELGLELEAVGAEQRHPARQAGPLVDQDHRRGEERRRATRAMIARTSRRCALSARLMGTGPGRADPVVRERPVQVGDRVALAGDVGPERRLGAEAPGASRSAGWCCRPERVVARCRRPGSARAGSAPGRRPAPVRRPRRSGGRGRCRRRSALSPARPAAA